MKLDFDKLDGLMPAIIQDASTQDVLMLGFMNAATYAETLETGFVTFFSRTRNTRWQKGESSGHRLVVQSIRIDCDSDTLLIAVEPLGPGVCHAGYRTCFSKELRNGEWFEVEPRSFDPKEVYA